jgi:hypothetical protein
MTACRDCSRCSEVVAKGCLMLPWRMTFGFLGRLTFGLFQKHCPQCNHRMNVHRMVKAGEERFQD